MKPKEKPRIPLYPEASGPIVWNPIFHRDGRIAGKWKTKKPTPKLRGFVPDWDFFLKNYCPIICNVKQTNSIFARLKTTTQ
jgi:hypothetical protein